MATESGRHCVALRGVVVCCAFAALADVAQSQPIAWLNPVTGQWNNAANWSGGGFPNSANALVTIDAINSNDPLAQYDVNLVSGVTVASLTVDSPNARFMFMSGGQLTSFAGLLRVKRGNMNLNGGFFFGTPSGVQIDAAGSLTCSANTTIPSGTPLTNAGVLSIEGRTLQCTNSAGITNSGALVLNAVGNSPAWLYSTNTLRNTGFVQINPIASGSHSLSAAVDNQGGGICTVDGPVSVFSGNTTNAGTFNVNHDYDLGLRSFTQTAGQLNFGPNGRIRCGTLTINGGTCTGPVNVIGDGTAARTLTIGGGTFFDPINVQGGATGCIINMPNPSAVGTVLNIRGNVTFPLISNAAGFDTSIAVGSDADPFAPTTVFTNGNQTFNGSLTLVPAQTSAGAIVRPLIDVFTGSAVSYGVTSKLDGIGAINCGDGPFTFRGAAFKVSDNITITLGKIDLFTPFFRVESTAEVFANLRTNFSFRGYGGRAAGVISPRFAASGAVSLAGTLVLRYVDPPTLHVGDSFVVLTGASITGTFSSVTIENAPPGLAFAIDYSTTEVRARVTSVPCGADFNADGFLTFEDFDAFVAAFENGDAIADFNADGFLTFEDFDAFVAAFESGC
ncbi:MAG: EF-hand domain-containing protein [Planctomycetota bacterium]|nr:EF-hand domain-containing protein [Planctomycetota bacterium]